MNDRPTTPATEGAAPAPQRDEATVTVRRADLAAAVRMIEQGLPAAGKTDLIGRLRKLLEGR